MLIITQVEVRSQNQINSHFSFFSCGAERVIFLLLPSLDPDPAWIQIRIWPDNKILDPVHP